MLGEALSSVEQPLDRKIAEPVELFGEDRGNLGHTVAVLAELGDERPSDTQLAVPAQDRVDLVQVLIALVEETQVRQQSPGQNVEGPPIASPHARSGEIRGKTSSTAAEAPLLTASIHATGHARAVPQPARS